jgi:hypothetical protein
VTKAEIAELAGKRLGDTSNDANGFLPILREVLDQVIDELAANECIGSLRREASYQFTAATSTYNSGTACGLASGLYPTRIEKLRVPAWEVESEVVKIEDEELFDSYVAQYGPTYQNRPRWWRIYPNEQTIEVFPVPRSDDTTASALKILYWAPPDVLEDADDIVEINRLNFHVIIAGLVWHGLPFQDETLMDRDRALMEWQSGMVAMRSQQQRARYGDIRRARYREL